MVRRTWSLVVSQLFRAIIAFLERTLICGLSLPVYCCLPTLRLRRGLGNLDLGVIVDEFDTGQDVRRDCKMLTGGDGEPSVHVSMYSGDVGPPDYYPTVRVTEPTYRGYPTLLQDDQKLYAWFDSEETFNAKASKYINENGSPVTEIVFADHQSLAMLQTMRLNDQMDIVVNGQVFVTAFLDGFTASYLKMAGECGFSGVGVVN